MKKNKRNQNAIVISFMFFSILSVLVGIFLYSYVYLNVLKIEDKKKQVQEKVKDVVKKQKDGINYQDFKSIYKKLEENEENSLNLKYIESITKSIDAKFFETYFPKGGNIDYSKLSISSQSKEQRRKELKLNFVLPSYVQDIDDIKISATSDSDNNGIHYLTDFRFISYLETIINTFNLRYNNPIGISDVTLVQDYAVTESGTTLDRNIYYIPVDLDLKGKKKHIMLFLYFLEHVGNIYVDNDQVEIASLQYLGYDPKEPSKIKKDKQKIVPSYHGIIFEGLQYSKINDYKEKLDNSYNIFNNQVIDIENISFTEYIDSDPSYGGLKKKINNLGNTLFNNIFPQFNDEFSFKVRLRFYVKGLPKYKIEELIVGTHALHKKLYKSVEMTLKGGKLDTVDSEKVNNMNKTLQVIKKQLNDIKNPKKSKGMSLIEKYNSSYAIKKILLEIEAEYNEIKN